MSYKVAIIKKKYAAIACFRKANATIRICFVFKTRANDRLSFKDKCNSMCQLTSQNNKKVFFFQKKNYFLYGTVICS